MDPAVRSAVEDEKRVNSCKADINAVLLKSGCVMQAMVTIVGPHIVGSGFFIDDKSVMDPGHPSLELPTLIRSRCEATGTKVNNLLKLHKCSVMPMIMIAGNMIVQAQCQIVPAPKMPGDNGGKK